MWCCHWRYQPEQVNNDRDKQSVEDRRHSALGSDAQSKKWWSCRIAEIIGHKISFSRMFGQESLCYGNLMDLCLALITERREEANSGASMAFISNQQPQSGEHSQMHSDSEGKNVLHQDTIWVVEVVNCGLVWGLILGTADWWDDASLLPVITSQRISQLIQQLHGNPDTFWS